MYFPLRFYKADHQIDLDTTLAQAEVLFLTFRGLVEDLDKDLETTSRSASTSASTSDPDQIGVGIRKRRGSGISIKSDSGAEVVKGGDVAELRGLVKGWGQEVRAEEDLEVVLSFSRRGSVAGLPADKDLKAKERPKNVGPELYMPLM